MSNIKLFQDKKIRTYHDEIRDQWYFSIVDTIAVLTDSSIPKRYWSDLKKKLLKEGFQLYEKIVQLKFEAADGKKYATDCAETSNLLRIIQSIPSPKAEPFKQWLAQVGYERLQEIENPELAQERMKELELIFTMLGERVTTEISEKEQPETFNESKKIARRGGKVAGVARKETEKELGRSISTPKNFLPGKDKPEIEND